MKLIIFGIVILLSLQGCSSLANQVASSRYIKSCISIYTASSTINKKNKKQCKKDKKIVTEILGEDGLKAENQQRGLIEEFTIPWVFLFVRIYNDMTL